VDSYLINIHQKNKLKLSIKSKQGANVRRTHKEQIEILAQILAYQRKIL